MSSDDKPVPETVLTKIAVDEDRCLFPILCGWQHEAILNTGSPYISALWANASQVTLNDISLHTFRPCPPGPFLLSSAGNWKVCDCFDIGRGPLYVALPSESPTAKDQHNIPNAKFLLSWSWGSPCLWCHRSSGSWHDNCSGAAAVLGYLVLHIKHGAVNIHLCHSSAINGPRLAITPGANIVWISHQLLSDASVLFVDPQHVLWSLDGVVCDPTTADSTGVLGRFLEDIKANTSGHVFFMLTQIPLLAMPAFHALSLEIHPLLLMLMSTIAQQCGTHAKVPPVPG